MADLTQRGFRFVGQRKESMRMTAIAPASGRVCQKSRKFAPTAIFASGLADMLDGLNGMMNDTVLRERTIRLAHKGGLQKVLRKSVTR